MDIELIKQFLTVARCLNISEAARQLHLSQPTLSRNIAILEKTLGQKLFYREKPLQLTVAGAEALTQLGSLWLDYQKIRENIRAIPKDVRGTLCVQDCTMLPSGLNLWAKASKGFESRCPNVEVQLLNCQTTNPFDFLAQGKLDVAFVWASCGIEPADIDPQFIYEKVESFHDESYLSVEKGHPLAEKDDLTLGDFRNERFIRTIPNHDGFVYDSFSILCEKEGFTPVYELISSPNVRDYYLQKLNGRVQLFPRSMAKSISEDSFLNDYLVFLKPSDVEISLEMYSVYLASTEKPEVFAFLETLHEN